MIKSIPSVIFFLLAAIAFLMMPEAISAEVVLQPDFTFESDSETEDLAMLRFGIGDQVMQEKL